MTSIWSYLYIQSDTEDHTLFLQGYLYWIQKTITFFARLFILVRSNISTLPRSQAPC